MLRFAREVWERRGHVSDRAFDGVREAGYGDAEILEFIAKVVETIFTNYVNDSVHTEVEFPWSKPAGVTRRPTLPFGKLAERRAGSLRGLRPGGATATEARMSPRHEGDG